jgi:hypothetical protein
MDYLPQLLAIQKQVNALVEQMTGVKTPSAKDTFVPDAPKKKRGRPSKKDLEAAAEAAAVAADAILAAGEAPEGPKKRGPQTPEAKAAAVAKRKATMERKKAEKAAEAAAMNRATEAEAEEEAMKRASEADEDAKSTVSSASTPSVASSKPKIKILKKTVPVVTAPSIPEPPTAELSEDQEEMNRIVYRYMFQLQEAGINMMNSGSWLKKGFSLSNVDAEDYVLNYISNYETLRSKYGDA